MILITVHVPPSWLRDLKHLVEIGRYPNVSEAIRTAIRDFLNREFGILRNRDYGKSYGLYMPA